MSPSRSTQVTIVNNLEHDLTLKHDSLSHGIWTQGQSPPSLIKAGSKASFQAESAGFMTGDEGTATYTSSHIGDFVFNFDNPFSGSNEYSHTAPSGYVASRSGGGGDNAEVTWTLEKVN